MNIMSYDEILMFNSVASYITIGIVFVFVGILIYSMCKVVLYNNVKMKDVVKKTYTRSK